MTVTSQDSFEKVADEYFDSLIKSRFIEMFGTINLAKQEKDWSPISDVGKIVTGSTPKTNIEEYWDGDIPWIAPAEIGNEKYISDTVKKITSAGKDSCSLTLMPSGTVLLSSRAPIGKVAITTIPMYCNQGFKNIICGDKLNNVYLYTLLKNNTEYLNSLGRGATFKEISRSIVANILIPLPDLQKQNEFAAFVEQVERSKYIFEQEISKLNQLIKSRFIEMFGDIQNNTKGWNTIRFGDIGELKTGGTPSSKHPEYFEGNIPWISSTALGDNYIDSSSAKQNITDEAIENSATSLIPSGSLIIGTRINVGKSSINQVSLCTSQDVTSLINIDPSLNVLFLKHCLDKYIPYLDSQKKGATIKGITGKLLKKLIIPVPPIDIQNQYCSFVEQVDKSKFEILKAVKNTLVV